MIWVFVFSILIDFVRFVYNLSCSVQLKVLFAGKISNSESLSVHLCVCVS